MIQHLRSNPANVPELQVAPDGLETSPGNTETIRQASGPDDALVDLFRHKSQVPVEIFLQHMEEQRQALESH
jgi:hypothetical protein